MQPVFPQSNYKVMSSTWWGSGGLGPSTPNGYCGEALISSTVTDCTRVYFYAGVACNYVFRSFDAKVCFLVKVEDAESITVSRRLLAGDNLPLGLKSALGLVFVFVCQIHRFNTIADSVFHIAYYNCTSLTVTQSIFFNAPVCPSFF